VNDAGIIVGAVTRSGDYQNFAYVYDTRTATGALLPIPPGFVQSSAYSVGNAAGGSVHIAGVVKPCGDMSCDASRGVRWTVDVNSLQATVEVLEQMAWAECVTDQGAIAGTHNSERSRRGAITQTAVLWKQLSGYVWLKPTSGSDSASRGMASGSGGTVFVIGVVNAKGNWTAARWVVP